MKKTFLFIALLAAGCSKPPVFSAEEGKLVAQRCIEQTGAPGVYSIQPGRVSASNSDDNLPRARAVVRLGGTKAGAAQINSCIQRKAAAV